MTRLSNLDIAIYLRKSRKDIESEKEAAQYGDNYDTLTKHRRELLNISKREGHNVIDIFEEVVSGEYIAERPEMKKLLENVKTMKYDAVLVMDIDRLGRGDKVDQGRIERAFKDSQTLIVTPHEIYDMSSESGEFNVEVRTFLSRMEYKTIKKRLQGGRLRSAQSGRDIGRKPPYGYNKDKDLKLYINNEEAKWVRLIFQWCIEGEGRVQIAKKLTEIGVPSPTGKDRWSHVAIRKILSNPKYKGDQVYGRLKWTKQENGKYTTRKSNEPQAYIENAHEPIIDRETWDKAQEAIEKRYNAPVKNDLDLINPLAGILRCKKCGNAILANNPSNRPSVYLYCGTIDCKQKMIVLTKVESVLLEQIESILSNLKANLKKKDRKKESHNTIVDISLKKIKKLEEEVQLTHKRRENLHDLLEDGTYDKETFLERSRKLQEKLKELEKELEVANELAAKEKERANHAINVIPNMQKAIHTYKTAKTIKEKNMILKSFIKEVKYNRESEWNGPYQFEIEIELFE